MQNVIEAIQMEFGETLKYTITLVLFLNNEGTNLSVYFFHFFIRPCL